MAVIVSLGLSLVALATMERSLSALRSASGDLAHVESAAALEGALQEAEVVALQSKGQGPLAITVSGSGGAVAVLAEAEASKVGPGSAQGLSQPFLAGLGVEDGAALRDAFAHLADGVDHPGWTPESLSAAPKWRACSLSYVSLYGAATDPPTTAPASPTPAALQERIGQIWRLKARLASGPAAERYVRFTGAPAAPAAVLAERLLPQNPKASPC